MGVADFFRTNSAVPALLMRPDSTLENAFNFAPVNPVQASRSLVLIYCGSRYAHLKSLLYFLASEHVCMLYPDSLSIEQKQNVESIYRPNFVIDGVRDDLRYPQILVDELFAYRFSTKPVDLAPGLKIIMSTSGVTGSPKAVKITEANLTTNTKQILGYLPIVAGDRCMMTLPVCYAYGLSVLLTHLAAGGVLVPNPEVPLSPAFWARMRKYKIQSFSAVPFRHETVMAADFQAFENVPLKYVTNAGGRLRPESFAKLANFCAQNKIQFFNMYGQTEATARIAYLPPEQALNKPGAIGRAVPGGKLTIDESGELLYWGENIFSGYAASKDDLGALEALPFLRTGDLARVDEDGIFFVTGRIKRVVKLNGLRINLDELEIKLSGSANAAIYCAGRDDEALVVFTSDSRLDLAAVCLRLKAEFPLLPASYFSVRYVEIIPLTENGKINYSRVLPAS